MRTKVAAMLAGSSLLAMAFPAFAQNADGAPAAEEGNDEIVVTGTFIRGIAPAGSNVIGVDEQDVQASGATSAAQLLSTIPQVSNMFNEVNATGQTSNSNGLSGNLNVNGALQINRPTLRNLTNNTASGSSTLVLVDGHRVVGAGVNQSVPDPDIVPPGAIQRVEVVPDGGSSLYGADAVGGVINFITRRDFDGLGVDARYGFADNYETYDTNLTAGTSWDSGSIYASFNYANKTPVFGSQRDYIQSLNYSGAEPVPAGLSCALGNVIVGTDVYGIGADHASLGAANTSANRCDNTDYQSISPDEERISLGLGFRQDLTENITFDTRLFYTTRDTTSYSGAIGGTETGPGLVQVQSTNPFYIPRFAGDTATQTVRFNFAPVNGFYAATGRTVLEEYGITPTLTIDLPAEWQGSLMANYGESEVYYRNPSQNILATDPNSPQQLVNAGLLNPYDIASSDPDALARTLDFQSYGYGRNELVNYRAVFDGPLFTLPGGEIRAAVGAEYIKESYDNRAHQGFAYDEGSVPITGYSRDVNAFFAELNVPIVGPDNNIPLVHALTLSLSERYDDYSDFGETTNPKIAITYEPVDWILFRANWGTSFNAPTVIDQKNASGLINIPFLDGLHPTIAGDPPLPGQITIIPGALVGSVPNLQPQEADTYSIGFDVSPPWVPGLTTSVTYYNIEFRGELGQAPFFNSAQMVELFPELVIRHPTSAQIAEIQAQASNPGALQPFVDDPSLVYSIIDARRRNLGISRHEGVDFAATYVHDTPFGSIDAGISGNYRLHVERSRGGAAPFIETDLDNNEGRFRYRANIGATWDQLYARATYTHGGGYNVPPNATIHQTEVDAFDVVDLFFRYDLGAVSVAKNLAVTLNVNNVFDEPPPSFTQDGGTGIANGSTLGRTFIVGLSSRF